MKLQALTVLDLSQSGYQTDPVVGHVGETLGLLAVIGDWLGD